MGQVQRTKREGERGETHTLTPAESCSDWLTRTLIAPSRSAAAARPGRGVFPVIKAIMRQDSEEQ